MNNTMIAQSYLPHQFAVDPRKLNFRMNPYEMANQQAQMQQIFLRQQMQQRYVSKNYNFEMKISTQIRPFSTKATFLVKIHMESDNFDQNCSF